MRVETLEWLKKIPPGEYSLMDLVVITRKDKNTLCRILKKLNVEKKYGEISHNNLVKVTYIWKGIN